MIGRRWRRAVEEGAKGFAVGATALYVIGIVGGGAVGTLFDLRPAAFVKAFASVVTAGVVVGAVGGFLGGFWRGYRRD